MIPQKAIDNIFIEISGDDGLAIYNNLKGKEDVNEFVIAEKLKITINQIRNIMYKFEQYNLVTSTRKKDRKKGWYIYFYTLNDNTIEQTILQLKREKISLLQRQLDREQSHDFYFCPNKCLRMPIENAMDINFTCTECGSLLAPEDQEKNIQKIKKVIEVIEQELHILESQVKKPVPPEADKEKIKEVKKVTVKKLVPKKEIKKVLPKKKEVKHSKPKTVKKAIKKKKK